MRFSHFFIPLLEDLAAQKAKRADFIKNTLGSKWQGLPGYEDIDQFIEAVSKVDPTPNGSFMPWIARLSISDPATNKTEDFDRLSKDLQKWLELKNKLEIKDINRYKTFQDVYLAIAPFIKKRAKTAKEKAKDREEAKLERIKQEIVTVYKGPEGWVRIPLTQKAGCFLGQNTRWCTASNKNNAFNTYNNTDRLFVIYDRESKKRYQLHIESGQFANEADTNIGINQTPNWAREHIVNWYKDNNPQFTLGQLMQLINFSPKATSIMAQHGLEDLGNLIAMYGVT